MAALAIAMYWKEAGDGDSVLEKGGELHRQNQRYPLSAGPGA